MPKWLQVSNQNNIPVVAFGASSGGHFAAKLAIRKVVDAAMVGVMSLGPDLVDQWVQMEEGKKPPIYFAPMPKDTDTLTKVEANYQTMKDSGGGGPVLLDKETCQARPLDASYLNDRVEGLTMWQAQAIVNSLTEAGHIDPVTGLLVHDPTTDPSTGGRENWKDTLQRTCAKEGCLENQSLAVGASPLVKAMNRAWAFHDYCSEVTLKALTFFDKELEEDALLDQALGGDSEDFEEEEEYQLQDFSLDDECRSSSYGGASSHIPADLLVYRYYY